ncbi:MULTISPECIES: asparaginase [Haloferax]|uniref:L-asparaginase n=2 Tax=Haloferax TaxID=2251 RepID=A0A6G1Z6E5_9EURY|nr:MULTISPECIES: asparaginase [Haloferax]KAB1185465.1 asparaginase [Haloferax sp. CBA1149]MRW82112.1 asparaginase [Haloferax marinisediminis]
MRPDIVVLSTGGTIASTSGDGGATPQKRGAELVEAVPELENYANLTVEEVAQRPSFDMDFETITALREAVVDAVDAGAAGIVVTHGTDTMEESAYALDLTLDVDAPVVFTGAQRRPDEISSDGPANLLTAVRFAAHEQLTGVDGVYIAFDEELHAARDVTKQHTSKLDTFGSPDKGPVAVTTRDGVRFFRAPGSRSVDIPVTEPAASVEMVKSGVGVGAEQVERAVDAGVDGLVVEGTGLGNVTSALGDTIADAIDAGVTVVVTSRCGAGSVSGVYGTGGGGATLAKHGVVSGGDLPAQKARLKLVYALSVVDDDESVREFFEA